ncbi:hypothetical protein HH_0114 [Helicobacter hepaticus ATCC 51449]|uniref:Uncharacterized protein n=1 Tax=Helicobacter hepaticus (strain ATCC 51449 / 3B1) TaxID=235279 RepID=Q7VJX8_HELHP|nr:hypothetical protein HH_0114 [Helicobacter hepaticus ATCC 51449]
MDNTDKPQRLKVKDTFDKTLQPVSRHSELSTYFILHNDLFDVKREYYEFFLHYTSL